MQKIQQTTGNLKTRGDLRRLSESGQQQSATLGKCKASLFPLWDALSQSYGAAFVNQFGDEPNDAWANGLAHYSDAEIFRGFEQAINSGSDYAPNLSTIVRCIAETRPRRYHQPFDPNQKMIDRGEGRLLPAPDVGKTPAEYLAEMRACTGGAK